MKYEGTTARFEDSKGFRIVHLLLSDPAVHYDVTELSRGPSLAQAINEEEIETGRGDHDSEQDDDAPDEVSQYESGYDEERERSVGLRFRLEQWLHQKPLQAFAISRMTFRKRSRHWATRSRIERRPAKTRYQGRSQPRRAAKRVLDSH